MQLSNDMTLLLNKIEKRLGLLSLTPRLPKELDKEAWAEVIKTDSLVTFSRFFPYEFNIVINDETCYKQWGDGGKNHGGNPEEDTMWYIIKDEVLEGTKLLGIKDIDWLNVSTKNLGMGTSLGGGYFYPNYQCIFGVADSAMALQMNADAMSLYNRGIYIDFKYPNRFSIKGLGNTNYDLNDFVITLLVEHRDVSTISPTKFELAFEALAQADVANFLWKNLRYFDNLETVYINIDLHLAELQDEAQKREQIIERLSESSVSMSNDSLAAIWTV